MNPVQIRPAHLTDETTIYQFICDLEETTLDQSTFQGIYRQNLINPAIHYLVAEQQGNVVGFVSCHVQLLLHHGGKVGEIQELFVQSLVRNQGIGQQLVAALKAIAVQEQFINLEVTTNQKRTDTIRFYEREAFHRTHIKLVYPIPS
ncbi:GNAT family N-acetyltransferase [Spirosoma aerolatum]|uniref:GNAT family N-acetyltransferase n=1 Tax=Spirosoma aerolatum TaxID=1211326 RepID=UPI0009ADF719|nr:GNAT family N-acetyltransferase [Spirosoma aerolatum]